MTVLLPAVTRMMARSRNSGGNADISEVLVIDRSFLRFGVAALSGDREPLARMPKSERRCKGTKFIVYGVLVWWILVLLPCEVFMLKTPNTVTNIHL